MVAKVWQAACGTISHCAGKETQLRLSDWSGWKGSSTSRQGFLQAVLQMWLSSQKQLIEALLRLQHNTNTGELLPSEQAEGILLLVPNNSGMLCKWNSCVVSSFCLQLFLHCCLVCQFPQHQSPHVGTKMSEHNSSWANLLHRAMIPHGPICYSVSIRPGRKWMDGVIFWLGLTLWLQLWQLIIVSTFILAALVFVIVLGFDHENIDNLGCGLTQHKNIGFSFSSSCCCHDCEWCSVSNKCPAHCVHCFWTISLTWFVGPWSTS